MSDQTVLLCLPPDVDQPPSVQLTLGHGILPVQRGLREQVFVASLKHGYGDAGNFMFYSVNQPRTPDLPSVDMFLQAHPLHRVEIKHELMISQLGPSYSNSNEEVYDIEINFHDMDSIMQFLS